jgi:hypothetical protein
VLMVGGRPARSPYEELNSPSNTAEPTVAVDSFGPPTEEEEETTSR